MQLLLCCPVLGSFSGWTGVGWAGPSWHIGRPGALHWATLLAEKFAVRHKQTRGPDQQTCPELQQRWRRLLNPQYAGFDTLLPWLGCSIQRNICYGLEAEDGLGPQEIPTAAQVEEAARLANAHDFIMALPQGYDTVRWE